MVRTSKDGRTIIGSSWNELGIEVNESKGQQKTICPNCVEGRTNKSDKALSVDAIGGVANCHYCGIHYLIDRGKKDFKTAEAHKTYRIPKQDISYDIDDNVKNWFEEERGISVSTLKSARVTSGSVYMPQIGKEMSTINFNYFFEDKLINVKYRDGKKNFKFESGAQLVFYNINCLLNPDVNSVIIVEGEIDALSYMEAGVSNVISVPNGASKGSMRLDYLTEYYDLFDNAWRHDNELSPLTKIIIATDADDAGEALKAELIRRLGSYRCYEVDFKGANDPNEHLLSFGKVSLYNTFDMASEVPIQNTARAHEFLGKIMKIKHDGGMKPGHQVGSDEFQKLYSYEPARLTIVTGVPTHGKTTFVDDQMCRLAVNYGYVFALFSPENFPIELHITKLISKISGKHFNHMEEAEIRSMLEFVNKHFIWIYPEDDDYRLRNILNITTDIIKRYGANALVIDPWTEIDKQGMTGTEELNDLLSEINQYKRSMGLHIFLVAHPTKMQKDQQTGMVDVPDLYSISGTANFYNKSDGGITVYRNFQNDTVEIYVNKVKFDHLGKIGSCVMKYNITNGRYQKATEEYDYSNWLSERAEQQTISANYN